MLHNDMNLCILQIAIAYNVFTYLVCLCVNVVAVFGHTSEECDDQLTFWMFIIFLYYLLFIIYVEIYFIDKMRVSKDVASYVIDVTLVYRIVLARA